MRPHSLFFILWLTGSLQTVLGQAGKPAKPDLTRRTFFTLQPLVMLEPVRGGIKLGAERTFGRRSALGIDAAWRFIGFEEQDLRPGEENRRRGFQLQPEFRWYLGVRPQSTYLNERAFRNALSLRTGYARYKTDVRTWTTLTDGSGNRYEKLLSHTRDQRNLDLALLLSRKFYFGDESRRGWGLEVFSGLGLRSKRFTYRNLSPELDADQLRREDERRPLRLVRDGQYVFFPLGLRMFYQL